MTNWPNQIYGLLPAVHQIRDGEQGEPLRAWLTLVGEQAQDLQDDIEQLYDNWFIETCDDWVIPYIGDLVGFRRNSTAGEAADAATPRGRLLNRFLYPRREIANRVRRRRRKGTLSVLEDMAKDVSGWPARAVEFSRLVNFFQNIKHPQLDLGRTHSIRDKASQLRINTPFDRVAHTVDVRQIQQPSGIGWYHPRHLGLFVWRRKVFSATKLCPCRVCKTIPCPSGRNAAQNVPYYTFNRIGTHSPIAVRPAAEQDELHIADEANLPGLLYRHLLADNDARASDIYYGIGDNVPKSLAIFVSWKSGQPAQLIPGAKVRVCDLTESRLLAFSQNLSDDEVAIDPERGIFVFGCQAQPTEVQVSFHYTSAMELGGGEYKRAVIDPPDFRTVRIRANDCCQGTIAPHLFELALKTLEQTPERRCYGEFIDSAQVLTREPTQKEKPLSTDPCSATWRLHDNLVIELTDSDTLYVLANERLQIARGKTLVVRSAQGAWPMLQVLPVDTNSCHFPWRILMEPGSKLVFDGLLIGGVTIEVANAGKSINPETKDIEQSVTCRPCDRAANSGTSAQSTEKIEVHLRHTTLVPGARPHSCATSVHASLSLKVSQAKLMIRHSIVGTLNVEHPRCVQSCGQQTQVSTCPIDPLTIEITDSIVDAADRLPALYSNCCSTAHADLTIERATVLGDVCVQQMTKAEDSLFAGIVHVQRRGIGYMRFCYVPIDTDDVPLFPNSEQYIAFMTTKQKLFNGLRGITPSDADICQRIRTPHRFKCVPEKRPSPDMFACATDCGIEKNQPNTAAFQPTFVSTEYGQPGFGELTYECDTRLLRGAEDESEIGVHHDLYRPQRDTALESRLQEYTPADIQSAVIYADDLHPSTF